MLIWMRHEEPDGPVFDIGDRIVIGWSRTRQVYWMQLLDYDGERVVDSVNVDATTEPMVDIEDLIEAVAVWYGQDEDPEIVDWADDAELRQQLVAATI
jgi:hypothetical protein